MHAGTKLHQQVIADSKVVEKTPPRMVYLMMLISRTSDFSRQIISQSMQNVLSRREMFHWETTISFLPTIMYKQQHMHRSTESACINANLCFTLLKMMVLPCVDLRAISLFSHALVTALADIFKDSRHTRPCSWECIHHVYFLQSSHCYALYCADTVKGLDLYSTR